IENFSTSWRSRGNKIVFDSLNLQDAYMRTKLSLVQFVDRAMMSPNEARKVFDLPPVDGGDELFRRLATAPVNDQGLPKDDEDDVDNGFKGGDDDDEGQDGDTGPDEQD